MKEQTAMQILFIELDKLGEQYSDTFKSYHLGNEREQIEQAWQDGYATGCSVGGNDYTTETENDTGANFFTTTYKQPL